MEVNPSLLHDGTLIGTDLPDLDAALPSQDVASFSSLLFIVISSASQKPLDLLQSY